MKNPANVEYVSQFLLAEFNSLQDRARAYEEIKSSRVNFFLLIVAAFGAVFSTILDISFMASFVYEALAITALIIFLLGIATLKTLIDYSVAIVIFYRKAGRIRKWFVNLDSEIEKYIAFDATDEKPRFIVRKGLIHWRGGELILLLINCFSASLFAVMSISYIFYIPIIIQLCLWVIAVVLFWNIQVSYIKRKMINAENSNWSQRESHFRIIEFTK